LGVLVLALAVPVAAQMNARISGEVKDRDGKPWPGISVVMKNNERGQTFDVVTDSKGNFIQSGMSAGVWTISFKAKDASGAETVFHEQQVRLSSGGEERLMVSLKDIIAKMSAEQKEQMKKQQEEQGKFEQMKVHFEAGIAAIAQARSARADMMKLPRAEQGTYQEKVAGFAATAVTELEQARDGVAPADSNYHIVMANLGDAYDEAGRYDDAASAYAKAIEAVPQTATAQSGPYYTKLGTAQARAGKAPEALAACEKGSAVDPTQAATCYRNVSIVLYNANKLKEAVEPLRKATALDPNNADQWYLLGASLLASAEYKKEGDKYITVFAPGTAEAYQKYLQLAPSGRFAKEAQDSLAALEVAGAGISTKVTAKKKRN
jgi:tetratricopeptide (TPR) repeat protein